MSKWSLGKAVLAFALVFLSNNIYAFAGRTPEFSVDWTKISRVPYSSGVWHELTTLDLDACQYASRGDLVRRWFVDEHVNPKVSGDFHWNDSDLEVIQSIIQTADWFYDLSKGVLGNKKHQKESYFDISVGQVSRECTAGFSGAYEDTKNKILARKMDLKLPKDTTAEPLVFPAEESVFLVHDADFLLTKKLTLKNKKFVFYPRLQAYVYPPLRRVIGVSGDIFFEVNGLIYSAKIEAGYSVTDAGKVFHRSYSIWLAGLNGEYYLTVVNKDKPTTLYTDYKSIVKK